MVLLLLLLRCGCMRMFVWNATCLRCWCIFHEWIETLLTATRRVWCCGQLWILLWRRWTGTIEIFKNNEEKTIELVPQNRNEMKTHYLEFHQRSSSAMTLCHRLWDCYCWQPETKKNKIKSNPVLIKMPLHWWPLPVIRNRWMWTMSCWACLDWFVYCFAHLLRFFASFLTFAYWLLHYWSHLPNYTLIDSYCQCHATSPSFSMWENVTSTVASERLCHRTDLTRNHCNSLQHLR